MYQIIGDTITLSVNHWMQAGLTYSQYDNDRKRGYLTIFRRGTHGNTLIDMASILRPERLHIIEQAYGPWNSTTNTDIYAVALSGEARQFYTAHRKPNGQPLDAARLQEYTAQASIFTAMQHGLTMQTEARARHGKRLNKWDTFKQLLPWYNSHAQKFNCYVYKNVRSFERAYSKYVDEGYVALLHKGEGGDNARIVSTQMENLFLSIWRVHHKPFVSRVYELYLEFISGTRELYDRETGEVYKPEDFRHKHRRLEISEATVWNYLKSVINNTAVYADRNGNFDYANAKRPKHHRKVGAFSLSKISMDDVCLSRKSVRGDVFKYFAVDVASGYIFRPAYIIGKPTHQTVYEAFRNMFIELSMHNLGTPVELEVENHLMKDIPWLESVFPYVRFCTSPTEKRAEHSIRSLKYTTAKNMGQTRGRWFSRSEAYKSVRYKKDGDFIEPMYDPHVIIQDDLDAIDAYNASLHPLQKTYAGLIRLQVLIKQANPNATPIEHWHLYKYIGNMQTCTLYNNDYVKCANEEFELVDFGSLERLKPNNYTLEAYWLPNEDGSVKQVYLYQGDTYIGTANNRNDTDYNEFRAEQTEADHTNKLHQQKRIAQFDALIRERKQIIPQVDTFIPTSHESITIIDELPETVSNDDLEYATVDFSKYKEYAIQQQ